MQHCHALLPYYSPSKVLAAQVDGLRALGVLQAVRSTTWSTCVQHHSKQTAGVQLTVTSTPGQPCDNRPLEIDEQQHVGMPVRSSLPGWQLAR